MYCKNKDRDEHAKRVLLVDDSPLNLMMMKVIFGKIGDFDFLTAKNGREALDCLNEHAAGGVPVDAVFTDLWMPEMTGDKLVGCLREDARFAKLPVYAVTTDCDIRASYAQMRFDGCCLKPYVADDLRTLMAGVGAEGPRARLAV